jgi:regulator of sigma E protease
MMDILQTVVVGLGALSLIVLVHEYGHFSVARYFGVGVIRFSIGFGTPFYKWTSKKTNTEFALAPIPLGGYVQMYGESPGEKEDPKNREQFFSAKPVWQRSAIVAAGPAINYLFAIMLYWFLALGTQVVPATIVAEIVPDTPASLSALRPGDEIVSVDGVSTSHMTEVHMQIVKRIADSGVIVLGYRRPGDDRASEARLNVRDFMAAHVEKPPLTQLGIIPRPLNFPVLSEVLADSAAARAGMLAGDVLWAADGKRIYAWSDWVDYIKAHAGAHQKFTVLRRGTELDLDVHIDSFEEGTEVYGRLGVRSGNEMRDDAIVRKIHYSPLAALNRSLQQVWDLSVLTLSAIGKIITGTLSPEQLSGPITIVKITGEAAGISWHYFLSLLALISLSIGLLNLLPIPVLDGGQLVYLAIEGVFRKPLPVNVQLAGQFCGAALLAILMIFVIYNDIIRL